jgi:hypothetical protein
MAIAERITSYTARVHQTSFLSYTRLITLKLEFGSTVSIEFPPVRPANWLQFPGPGLIDIWMTAADYDDVYHLLQTEDPVFCTALNLFGLQVGAVHTELDLSRGEPTGEGYRDGSLEALIVRAKAAETADSPAG